MIFQDLSEVVMVAYSVKKEDDQWYVYERPTEQKIKGFENKKCAENLKKMLNKGNGFDGATPAFFLIQ